MKHSPLFDKKKNNSNKTKLYKVLNLLINYQSQSIILASMIKSLLIIVPGSHQEFLVFRHMSLLSSLYRTDMYNILLG